MKRTLMLLVLCLMTMSASAEEKSVPKKIGNSVKKGGEAAGRGIEKGADATVEGLKHAETWIGKKMQKGGEKLEKASK